MPDENAGTPTSNSSTGARDAILYIPGLGDTAPAGGVEGAARRIAEALDRQSLASYTVAGVQVQKLPRAGATPVVTISRSEGAQTVPVADVYEVDFSAALSGGFAQLRPIRQGIAIIGLLLLCVPKLLAAIGKPGKSWSHKWQVVYAGAFLVLLAAYLPVVLATVISMVYAAVPGLPHYTLRSFDLDFDRLSSWVETLIVVLTAAGFFTRFSLKEQLANFAAQYMPALRYVAAGGRQGMVQGTLANLVNDIEDRQAAGGQSYRSLQVIAYSFGTIIALDTLFPRIDSSPLLGKVSTLVTIGCPFDFVRTYYPDYFRNRKAATQQLTWFNVFDPVDVLGSNFEDEPARGQERGNRVGLTPTAFPTNLEYGQPATSKLEWMVFSGFRRHAQYWERMETGDINCFDLIVPRLYPAPAPAPALAP